MWLKTCPTQNYEDIDTSDDGWVRVSFPTHKDFLVSAVIVKYYKGSRGEEIVINASSMQLLFERFYEEYWKLNYGVPNSTMFHFKSKSLEQEYDEWRKKR
jgi:hypothetical protein